MTLVGTRCPMEDLRSPGEFGNELYPKTPLERAAILLWAPYTAPATHQNTSERTEPSSHEEMYADVSWRTIGAILAHPNSAKQLKLITPQITQLKSNPTNQCILFLCSRTGEELPPYLQGQTSLYLSLSRSLCVYVCVCLPLALAVL